MALELPESSTPADGAAGIRNPAPTVHGISYQAIMNAASFPVTHVSAGIQGVHAAPQNPPQGDQLDEQDAKRLKRKINNRESARRSRQKKADEITRLTSEVKEKEDELQQCRATIASLRSHLGTLVKIVHQLGGSVDAAALNAAVQRPAQAPRESGNTVHAEGAFTPVHPDSDP